MGWLYIEAIKCESPSSGTPFPAGATIVAAGLAGGIAGAGVAIPSGPAGMIVGSVIGGLGGAASTWVASNMADDLFLTINGKRILTGDIVTLHGVGSSFYSISKGATKSIQKWLEYSGSTCTLELWDYDLVGSNDLLGRLTLPHMDKDPDKTVVPGGTNT
jgi:hypothetical protein